jgi:hypothetical protein
MGVGTAGLPTQLLLSSTAGLGPWQMPLASQGYHQLHPSMRCTLAGHSPAV